LEEEDHGFEGTSRKKKIALEKTMENKTMILKVLTKKKKTMILGALEKTMKKNTKALRLWLKRTYGSFGKN